VRYTPSFSGMARKVDLSPKRNTGVSNFVFDGSTMVLVAPGLELPFFALRDSCHCPLQLCEIVAARSGRCSSEEEAVGGACNSGLGTRSNVPP